MDDAEEQQQQNWPRRFDVPEVDTSTPSAARAYDYFLGGSHNFGVDRAFVDAVEREVPCVRAIAGHNREFLWRVVRYLADAGVDQFLDLGSGIPTVGNVHEIAQAATPGARVVYVDHEPIAYGRRGSCCGTTRMRRFCRRTCGIRGWCWSIP